VSFKARGLHLADARTVCEGAHESLPPVAGWQVTYNRRLASVFASGLEQVSGTYADAGGTWILTLSTEDTIFPEWSILVSSWPLLRQSLSLHKALPGDPCAVDNREILQL
jgi:hypothetical protein